MYFVAEVGADVSTKRDIFVRESILDIAASNETRRNSHNELQVTREKQYGPADNQQVIKANNSL